MIGIVLETLSGSQKTFELVQYVNNNPNDIVLFVEELSLCQQIPKCPIMSTKYCYHHKGILIGTEMMQMDWLNRIPNTYYWAWDYDWLRPRGREFEVSYRIHKQSNTIARTESLSKAIKQFCGKDSEVVHNVKELVQWTNGKRK